MPSFVMSAEPDFFYPARSISGDMLGKLTVDTGLMMGLTSGCGSGSGCGGPSQMSSFFPGPF